jgi:hypothetical protein
MSTATRLTKLAEGLDSNGVLSAEKGGTGATTFSGGASTPSAVSDQANTSTGYFDLPVGTTGQRPASPGEGNFRINSTTSALEVYYLGFWTTIKSLGLSLAISIGRLSIFAPSPCSNPIKFDPYL